MTATITGKDFNTVFLLGIQIKLLVLRKTGPATIKGSVNPLTSPDFFTRFAKLFL